MTRRRRRVLRCAMWVCVACSAVLFALWAWSGWYQAVWIRRAPAWWMTASLDHGAAQLRRVWSPERPGSPKIRFLSVSVANTKAWCGRWMFDWNDDTTKVAAPLWFISLLPLAPAAFCFRLSRRSISGLCPRCRYDLSGVPAGTCPECGRATGG